VELAVLIVILLTDAGASPGSTPLRTARHAGQPLHLTHREVELLRCLAERTSRVVLREELLREAWGYPDVPVTRSVDTSVAGPRKKIEPDAGQD
jgi:DNA-binding response OmpR family regulator